MNQNHNLKSDEKIVVQIDQDLEDLIPGYLENRRENVKSIVKAISEGDFETIEILGHSMKGSGGGYGFKMISEIGGIMETAAEEKNKDEIINQNEKLSSYLDRVEVVYEGEKK